MPRSHNFPFLLPLLGFLSIVTVGGTSVGSTEMDIPEPLSLPQALKYAERHPRIAEYANKTGLLPRPTPLYLNCHNLAYTQIKGSDQNRNQLSTVLIHPIKAQQLTIMQHYFDVLLSDLSFAHDNESMSIVFIALDRAKARNELGQYSDLQVAELNANYHNRRQQRAASETTQQLSRILLAQSIGHPKHLSRDLNPPKLAIIPTELPNIDHVLALAQKQNHWLKNLREKTHKDNQPLIDMRLRQQLYELLLQLQLLKIAEKRADADIAWRDLKLEYSRTLYEQEVKADLGNSMAQQTQAIFRKQQIIYCQNLTWSTLNALQGKTVTLSSHKTSKSNKQKITLDNTP